MKFCGTCGTQMEDDKKFCVNCGAAMDNPEQSKQLQQSKQPQQNAVTKLQGINQTADTTAEYDPADIEQNKAMGILSYIGILVLIPLLVSKNSKFSRFHANQGLILCIAEAIYFVAFMILSFMLLAISWRLYMILNIIRFVGLIFLVLSILGIINAVNGKAKELPVIGKFKILK